VAAHILVPRPMSATIGGPAVKDLELLDWCSRVITDVLI
jgi:transcription-repair coupling factor (superfamily II helicase)